MSTTTAIEPVIHERVMDVLERHNCVAEFWDRIALARECVPEMERLDVRIVHDPDEDGWVWVEMAVKVPATVTWERCMELQHQYIHREVERRFPSRLMISFALIVEPSGG